MSVPKLETCCFCVNLVTGSLIIGYLYTVTALLEMIFHGIMLTFSPVDSWELADRSTKIKFFYSIFSVFICSLQVFVGMLLIVGTTRRKAGLMLPWTVTVSISAALYFLLFLVGVSLLVQDIIIGDELLMIGLHFVRTCISVYCVMVVHSLHKKILQQKLVMAYAYRMIAQRKGVDSQTNESV